MRYLTTEPDESVKIEKAIRRFVRDRNAETRRAQSPESGTSSAFSAPRRLKFFQEEVIVDE